MILDFDLPDEISNALRLHWGDIQRRSLEAIAAEGYRSGALSHPKVGKLLGHAAVMETEVFLKRANAYLDYSPQDLEKDISVYHSQNGR
jgi:hypothetical protein